MLRRPRSKKQRDIAFGLLVVLLLFLCFLYMSWVFTHLSSLQGSNSKRNQQQQKANLDDLKQGGAAEFAEDEVEGGVDLSSWQLLRSGGAQLPSPQKRQQETQRPLGDMGRVEKAHDAQEGDPRHGISSSVAPQPQLEGAREQPPPTTSSPADLSKIHSNKIHAKPLTAAEHLFEAQLIPRDQSEFDPTHHPLVQRYHKDVFEYEDLDAVFYQTNGHIFSHLPMVKRLFQSWVKLNLDMRQGRRTAKYVIVHPVGQLCNRLMAIASAAMFAMITKRGLIVDDNGFYCSMNDLFELPGFEWLDAGASAASVDLSHAAYIANPEAGVWEETEKLLCASDLDAMYPQPHVDISINQFMIPYLTRNPHIGPQLRKLFRGEDTLFYSLSHFLFRPIPKLLAMRDQVVQKHFSSARAVVGLQLRSGGDFTDHFMDHEDLQLYKDCAETIASGVDVHGGAAGGVHPNAAPLVFFVATDTAKGREAALAHLSGPGRQVVFGPTDFLLSNHPEGVQMALLDLLLLAAADDRVTTAWSSYGYFAAGYSGVRAAMVVDEVPESEWIAKSGTEQRFMGIPHKSDKRVQCVRLPTFQPCFHKFESWGASKATCYTKEMRDREQLGGRYC